METQVREITLGATSCVDVENLPEQPTATWLTIPAGERPIAIVPRPKPPQETAERPLLAPPGPLGLVHNTVASHLRRWSYEPLAGAAIRSRHLF